MTRLVIAMIAAICLVAGMAAAPAGAQEDHDLRIVMIRDTNLYAEASLEAEVLTVIPEGTELYYQHNVSGTGFMFMSYDGNDGWIELDSFVSYTDYYGTDDVESLPVTGVGAVAGGSSSLPVLGLMVVGLMGAAGLSLKVR